MDDGADVIGVLHGEPPGAAGRDDRRHRGDDDRRDPAARAGGRRASSASRSSRSTRPTPSTCSTTATAPASRRSTASCARPTCCWPGGASSSAATAGAAAASPTRARGMGAHVIVVEVDPLRALQAVMDGFRVMPIADAARTGDIFITATGDKHVLRGEHFERDEGRRDPRQLRPLQRRDRHPGAARAVAGSASVARPMVEQFDLADGRRIFLLAEGRLVNLAAAEGHPAVGDGHELRQPGAGGRAHGQAPRRAREAGLRRAARHRRRDRRAQARPAWASRSTR